MDFDHCVIQSYNVGTGEIECVDTLSGYHFGAGESTAKDFEVDMRAEVMLLERNVKIRASTHDIGNILKEMWGCRILVSDFFEPNLTYRKGSLTMDNVQVFNCSQRQTYKPAIKFENASSASRSVISNSVFNTGKGMGAIIENSVNIALRNNVFADFVQQGIWVQRSDSITIDGNWVHHIVPECDQPPKINQWPIVGHFEVGGITASEGNSKMVVMNNIVSGAWQAAYHFKPLKCGASSSVTSPDYHFVNNIAHSISGNGAVAAKVSNSCTEVKDFIAYKCTHSAIMLGGPSKINRGTNLVSIDNHWGLAIHSGDNGRAEIESSRIYGEDSANRDCPVGSTCDHCLSSTGIVLNQPCAGSHLDSQVKWFKHPLWKLCTGGIFATTHYNNVEFKNFDSGKKKCGAKMVTFSPWKKASDYIAFAEFKRTTFNNVHSDALTNIPAPSQGWKNWEDCGLDFTCTGLYNVVVRFEQTRYTGDQNPGTKDSTFEILSNNAESDSTNILTDNRVCEFKKAWNAHLCKDQFGVLVINSLDADRMDRSAQPIYIKTDDICNESGKCFNNRLNAFMDMCWDGFYTCQ